MHANNEKKEAECQDQCLLSNGQQGVYSFYTHDHLETFEAMKQLLLFTLCALLLLAPLESEADSNFGLGARAGTLGIGLEATWRALPWVDLRAGFNRHDYDNRGTHADIPYNATLAFDNYYTTANLRFPLNPLRLTVGVFSNSNELQLTSAGDGRLEIGGSTFNLADVGTMRGITSFSTTAPYLGIGGDFAIFGRVGLNLDLGVLWQGKPRVTLNADGVLESDPIFQSALEAERRELDNDISSYKAWPVFSLGIFVNFF